MGIVEAILGSCLGSLLIFCSSIASLYISCFNLMFHFILIILLYGFRLGSVITFGWMFDCLEKILAGGIVFL
ncbi:hypothetical protein LINGRAHAP2_LOCUS20955 [Linum grandiflorum]